jgi:hypothetical protein
MRIHYSFGVEAGKRWARDNIDPALYVSAPDQRTT